MPEIINFTSPLAAAPSVQWDHNITHFHRPPSVFLTPVLHIPAPLVSLPGRYWDSSLKVGSVRGTGEKQTVILLNRREQIEVQIWDEGVFAWAKPYEGKNVIWGSFLHFADDGGDSGGIVNQPSCEDAQQNSHLQNPERLNLERIAFVSRQGKYLGNL